MNRVHWQQLAEERVNDARFLLDGGQWAGAYYLAGYAIECGLKACVVAYVTNNADVVYRERKYSEKCWTHDISTLVEASGLEAARLADAIANAALGVNWAIVEKWDEKTRYQLKTEPEAKRLYDAVTHNFDGVLPWIRIRW